MAQAAVSRPGAGRPPVPTSYAGFRNLHAGETILVCGLGASLNLLAEPERFLTIGVNDIGRRFDPDYLLVLNTRAQFTRERFAYIAASRSRALFSHLKLDVAHPNLIQAVLGSYGAPDFTRPDRLAHTRNSPYVAVCLAVYMGARRIGLIGVDFTDHHFFGETGRHPLAGNLARMEQEYRELARACAAAGVELVNLSPESRIASLPRMDLGTFAGEAKSERALKIVSYATTPVAGVPHVLTRCIMARTPHRAETVWPRAGYGNGVEFGGGIESQRHGAAARTALEAADLVVLHNGFVAAADRALMETKPTLTLAHNYKWNVDDRFVRKGAPGLVVAQYQAALPEFSGWTPVPQPMPLWEEAFRPEPKGDAITIAYTPSGKHERYPRSHRLYWHAKGYETTLAVLDRLARRHGVKVEAIRGTQVSHSRSLAMKRQAHIVIDECVTGSYHRNSLEGLAAGAVVVNGLGLVPEIAHVVRDCLRLGAEHPPFVEASLETLEAVLEDLVSTGPDALARRGLEGRAWLERHWDFHRHWGDIWVPAIDRAMGEAPRPTPPRPTAPTPKPPPPQMEAPTAAPLAWGEGEVTVVIPHRGLDRLPLLDACLAGLRRVSGIAEVLVVELAADSLAGEVCTRRGARHLFCRTTEAFEKGRALNIATPFAGTDFILWLDNDMLLPADFLVTALAEMRARGLDSLTPWHFQHYLSEPDSTAVIADARPPDQCTPVRRVQSGRGWVGAAELVRRAFLLSHGGVPSGFLGWGGEDNAWIIKARLLGLQAASRNEAQTAYHLFHPTSNGYAYGAALKANPHYPANLALMRRMQALRGRADFLRHFPPPTCHPAPWEGARRVAAAAGMEPVAARLHALFGPAVIRVDRTEPHDLLIEGPPASSPDVAARVAAWRLAGLASASSQPSVLPASPPDSATPMRLARQADFDLPEFAATRRLGPLPRARAWELPFAVRFGHIPPAARIVDRSLDPVALDRLVAALHADATLLSRPAGADPDRLRALDIADGSADLVTCLNTLDSLPPTVRPPLMQDMARMLRPGSRLMLTCDHHFDAFFRRPHLPPALAQLQRITPDEVAHLAREAGLLPLGPSPALPEAHDPTLFRNIEPCPHALMGFAFSKPGTPVATPPIALALLPGEGQADQLAALRREAEALIRLGHPALLFRPPAADGMVRSYERALTPERGGVLALREACTQAAIAAGATSLFMAEAGFAVPPMLVPAMTTRLAALSSDVAALSCTEAVASPLPVLVLTLGPPRPTAGPLTLWRLPGPPGGVVLAANIAP